VYLYTEKYLVQIHGQDLCMKALFTYLLVFGIGFSSFSQNESSLKFISVPHPRSENTTQQSVLPAIEKIDFSLYDMTLLGGDLTYYTSINRTSMDYCDKLFNLKSPNTLWTMGNHDLNSRSLIREYTGRPSYYCYYRDHITFVVLDVELDASGLTKSVISGAQLNWLKTISDTISKSDYMLILHGRLLWMIGNDDFKTRLDSVAESTKQLVTTNFYPDVFPLLQKVKAKGIPVICLGGDKSKINIDYSPEDSIHFLASTMAPEFTDNQNKVLVFMYENATREMSWKYVSLANVEKKNPGAVGILQANENPVLRVWQTLEKNEIGIDINSYKNEISLVQVYTINGILCRSIRLKTNEIQNINLKQTGIFILKATVGKTNLSREVVVQ
jgi:hypothetical protein